MNCTECTDGRWYDASHGCSRECKACKGRGTRAHDLVPLLDICRLCGMTAVEILEVPPDRLCPMEPRTPAHIIRIAKIQQGEGRDR